MNKFVSSIVAAGKAVLSNVKDCAKSALRAGVIGAGSAVAGSAHAVGTTPLDMQSTADTIAGYLPAAGAAGLTVFAVWFGISMIRRVFQIVA